MRTTMIENRQRPTLSDNGLSADEVVYVVAAIGRGHAFLLPARTLEADWVLRNDSAVDMTPRASCLFVTPGKAPAQLCVVFPPPPKPNSADLDNGTTASGSPPSPPRNICGPVKMPPDARATPSIFATSSAPEAPANAAMTML